MVIIKVAILILAGSVLMFYAGVAKGKNNPKSKKILRRVAVCLGLMLFASAIYYTRTETEGVAKKNPSFIVNTIYDNIGTIEIGPNDYVAVVSGIDGIKSYHLKYEMPKGHFIVKEDNKVYTVTIPSEYYCY